MIMFVAAIVSALMCAGFTVMIVRAMFKSCMRHDLRHDGCAPSMFHVVDPYIAGLVETLYQAGRQKKTDKKRKE